MAVDAAAIQMISNGLYTVSETTGSVNNATFTYYLNQATAIATTDLPADVNSVIKEEAIALLVCHRIERAFGKTDITSENLGGEFSYSRKDTGETSWSLSYNLIVAKEIGRAKKGKASVSASHASGASDFKLDITAGIT